jgi:capsular exopolysaccharide synthesis family protein
MVSQEDFAESYRTLRTAISGKTRGHRDKSFLVTSARSGEGKTSLAVSLAISFTEPGHRVLLIDGDTQAPNASRVLKLKPGFGLSDALVGDRTARECVVPSGIPQLDVLVCQANGKGMAGLLDSRTAESVLNALGDSYDYIILDSPPALSASDALVWATVVDGVVLASFIGETDRTAMGLTCERLEAVGARILGSVAANVPWNSRFYSYSSTSYERQQRGGDRDAGARQHPLLNARLGDEVHSS